MDLARIDLGPERDRRSVVELIGQGVLDSRLAATAWLLVERRVPLLVAAGPSGTGKTVLLRALLAFLPPDTTIRTIEGAWETWSWLPAEQLAELGMQDRVRSTEPGIAASGDRVELVVPEFSSQLPIYSWGPVAHAAIRLASRGFGLAGTVHAESLEEVFAALGGRGVGATSDELSHLGLVLVVRAVDPGLGHASRRRVVAAHYLRPLARDVHGHVQRLDPAVVATWDAGADAFEDFAWGVMPEIAARLDRPSGEVERDRDRRAAYLDALVAAGAVDEVAVASAIARFAP
jgi:energy-coupling factor transporter ATP-binding protein EcfA2